MEEKKVEKKVEEKYIWNTKDIYQNIEQFNEAVDYIKNKTNELESLKGTLNTAENIYRSFELEEDIDKVVTKVYAYAMLKHHENTADEENSKLYKFVVNVCNECAVKIAYITPEMLKMDLEDLKNLTSKDSRLLRYKINIEDLIEHKPHVLSEEVETAVSTLSHSFSNCDAIFETLTDTDFVFKDVADKDGKLHELTHGTYILCLESKDAVLRENAFNAMYDVFKQYIHTLTETYTRHVKLVTTLAKLRKYTSSLESAVKVEDSTVEVYNNLIETVGKNLDFNYRYIALKKKVLKLDSFHIYDLFLDITEAVADNIPYDEAKNIVKDALNILGEEYVSKLEEAMENRWIHVYEQKAKRSGAYSMGVYGVHPYVLLNYAGNNESVSTLAHELGHAMHSYYSSKAQTYVDSDYTIMVAEVASTVNETLLANYLINKETDKVKKASLINSHINGIRSTLIRQTMFAEFEKMVHEAVEAGHELASEDLCGLYYELNKKYFGDTDIIVDENIKYEWARIPHFYSAFYVYKYATGISAAIAIAKRILAKEDGYAAKYIEMLKMGGSVKSLDQLKSVGVDLTTEVPVQEAFAYLNEKLDELEELLK
ncbi:MAG: oligoendopeptidase F [Clostridia bacterium]